MAKSATSVTLRLRGGPFDGQSAVAMGATVGSLIAINTRNYRVTKIENVPGRREQAGIAIFERPAQEKPKP